MRSESRMPDARLLEIHLVDQDDKHTVYRWAKQSEGHHLNLDIVHEAETEDIYQDTLSPAKVILTGQRTLTITLRY